jgi:hypothetical protein
MHNNVTRIMGSLHEYLCKCMISCLILLRMRCSRQICRENQNSYFMFISPPPPRTVYEIMWKKNVEPGRPQITVRRVRISCRIHKATNIFRMCNTYCFFTAAMVTRTRKNDTLYLYCMSSLFYSLSVSLTRPCSRSHVVYFKKISERSGVVS